MEQISVTVFRPKGRKYYQAQWVDPITGRKKTRSTGANIKRDAERFAGKLQSELNSGTYHGKLKTKWKEFRERYESEVVPGMAKRTGEKVRAAFRAVERIVNPKMLATVNSEQISRFTAELRREGLAEPSVKGHLAHLKSALRWAHGVGLLAKVPKITMPKRTAGMKGRPLTTEEFERMLAAVPKVVGRNLRRNRTRIILKLARATGPARCARGGTSGMRMYDCGRGGILASPTMGLVVVRSPARGNRSPALDGRFRIVR